MGRPCGLLLLDKPAGPSSHDIVAAIRRAAGERRVGHAGTLDPIATGLLLVCIGAATRICEYLAGHDKRYYVEVRLGVETATYDRTGEVVATFKGVLPTDREIAAAVDSFQGEMMQQPPAYSAVKVNGKPLYLHARKGIVVPVPPRKITIHSLSWQRPEMALLRLTVHCSAGTYIRSLVHDLGQVLGCGAHVTELRRLSVGPFNVEEAWTLHEATRHLAAGDWSLLRDIRNALVGMPVVSFDELTSARLRRGQTVAGADMQGNEQHLALDQQGHAIGIVMPATETALSGAKDGQLWRPRKVFA
ncbi:MAG: tRNA pseudouridine(55) synthase TruB [Anaerolineae bacterium]